MDQHDVPQPTGWCKLRDRGQIQPCIVSPIADLLTAKVSVYADSITVFVSRHLDIKAMKKAVAKYEQIAGAKNNFEKSEDLRQDAWKGGFPLSGLFHWSDRPVHILGV